MTRKIASEKNSNKGAAEFFSAGYRLVGPPPEIVQCTMEVAMTPAGWIFMVVSITAVTVLLSYCYYRILTAPPPQDPAVDKDTNNE